MLYCEGQFNILYLPGISGKFIRLFLNHKLLIILLSDYNKLLEDERWRSKRIEILRRDDFTCKHCLAKGCILQVHHITRGPKGSNAEPWECSNDCLVSLCVPCHNRETFYGNDAQRYLWKVIARKEIPPETIRNLNKAVKDIFNVRIDARFKLRWTLKDREEETFKAVEIIHALTDLINTIGQRFPSHPFMNNLIRIIETEPDIKSRDVLRFWFELI